MKTINYAKMYVLFVFIFTAAFLHPASAGENFTENTTVSSAEKVKVYYFHNARRCTTCKTVEAETKKALQSLYNGKVEFVAYSLEDANGKKMATDLKVNGQTLLIVGKNEKINITNEGFLHARSNPEKFKQIIKEKIDPLIG